MINGTKKRIAVVVLAVLFGSTSCTPDIVPEATTVEAPTPISRMFVGDYRVRYKEIKKANGDLLRFLPIGSTDMTMDGWMSETILTFTKDSLGIKQLMSQGWSEGSVTLKWENGIPKRVGCRWVESVSETHIAWYQDDDIIINYLEKL